MRVVTVVDMFLVCVCVIVFILQPVFTGAFYVLFSNASGISLACLLLHTLAFMLLYVHGSEMAY